MALKITISNKVGFVVKGELNDENGAAQPFDFKLIAKRLDEDEMSATQARLVIEIGKTGNHQSIVELLCGKDDGENGLIVNWSNVKDADGAELAFSQDNLRQLLKVHRAMAGLVWRTYQNEAGAKEKN